MVLISGLSLGEVLLYSLSKGVTINERDLDIKVNLLFYVSLDPKFEMKCTSRFSCKKLGKLNSKSVPKSLWSLTMTAVPSWTRTQCHKSLKGQIRGQNIPFVFTNAIVMDLGC